MTAGPAPTELPSDSRLTIWLSYGLLFTGIGSAIASAYIVISTYSPLPHWDEWALFAHLATGKGWSLSWLWAQHNEHRIFVPKIFFLLDVQFFRGTQVFLLASIFATQFLQISLLSFSLWSLGDMRGPAWRTGIGLIVYCILCPTQYENLVWGFQLQFVIPAAMATVSTLSLLLYYRRPRVWLLALSIAAATLATWSLANGMLLWPLLLLAALLLRMRRRIVVAVAASAVANIGLYLYHYHRPSAQSGVLPAQSVGEILKYVAVYFGSTFVRHSSGWSAILAGTMGLCTALWIIARVILQRGTAIQSGTRSLLLLELSLLMLLCIATAAITASGRLHLGLEQATASRYQTFALLFWCSLGLAVLFYASRNSTRFTAISASLLALMLGFATQVRLPLIDAQWRHLRLQTISLALLTGVHDPAVLADAYPDPQVVLRAAQYMKENRLSIFAGRRYSQLGQPLEAVYKLQDANECSGYVSSSQVLPADDGNGLRLRGYAWDRQHSRPAREIVAVGDGRIEGFGESVSIPLTSAALDLDSDAARFGWLAFVRNVSPPTRIELYAVTGKHSAYVCRFANTLP